MNTTFNTSARELNPAVSKRGLVNRMKSVKCLAYTRSFVVGVGVALGACSCATERTVTLVDEPAQAEVPGGHGAADLAPPVPPGGPPSSSAKPDAQPPADPIQPAADPKPNVPHVPETIFFANSSRRDASEEEASRVAKIRDGGCTAFFLENSAGKTYLATARHCGEYKITAWCEADGHVVDNALNSGFCTRIVAADVTHDIAVFEADLPHSSTGSSTLVLSPYLPSDRSPLVMIGYPGDSDPTTGRYGKLTVTESCWTVGGAVASPYPADRLPGAQDWSQHHNCTTYGGNSGGPMYLAGTRLVVGLPFTYLPNDYTRHAADDVENGLLALAGDFVGVHRVELEAAGITIGW